MSCNANGSNSFFGLVSVNASIKVQEQGHIMCTPRICSQISPCNVTLPGQRLLCLKSLQASPKSKLHPSEQAVRYLSCVAGALTHEHWLAFVKIHRQTLQTLFPRIATKTQRSNRCPFNSHIHACIQPTKDLSSPETNITNHPASKRTHGHNMHAQQTNCMLAHSARKASVTKAAGEPLYQGSALRLHQGHREHAPQ